ncbi:hypothetical protein EVAR_25753_1 [Eumeta japonica]|uniref:Uncharacterized protein n=1 Tax=Eumeta variegata TaxID=151549 RepID=A0A4C1V7S6_EUMVA|nr:hypothetical protein EVAR_25753_1 [Eumeta japonica]
MNPLLFIDVRRLNGNHRSERFVGAIAKIQVATLGKGKRACEPSVLINAPAKKSLTRCWLKNRVSDEDENLLMEELLALFQQPQAAGKYLSGEGHLRLQRSHQCVAGLLGRNRISGETRNELMMKGEADKVRSCGDGEGMNHPNSNSLNDMKQQKLLLNLFCESVVLRRTSESINLTAAQLTTAWKFIPQNAKLSTNLESSGLEVLYVGTVRVEDR